jgi:hypothetical protein
LTPGPVRRPTKILEGTALIEETELPIHGAQCCNVELRLNGIRAHHVGVIAGLNSFEVVIPEGHAARSAPEPIAKLGWRGELLGFEG